MSLGKGGTVLDHPNSNVVDYILSIKTAHKCNYIKI